MTPLETSPPDVPVEQIGVIVVDHGSRRAESNELLLDVVALFTSQTAYTIVEPAGSGRLRAACRK